jgi:hypothetical protein
MNALAFPAAVVAIWSTLALAVGYGLRKLLGKNRLVLALVLVGLLVPWCMHHLKYIQKVQFWLSQNPGRFDTLPLETIIAGPIVVILLTAVAVAFSGRLGRIVAVVPVSAFYITYYLTFSLLSIAAAPGWYGDNMPTIWLFMWSVGATILVLAYSWPSHAMDSNNARTDGIDASAP